MREVGRAAGRQRSQELGIDAAPAEGLLLDFEAGELPFELRDRRVLDGLDRLRLDLRVPDVQLARLLAERGRRARQQRGPGGGNAAGPQEVPAGKGVGGPWHRFRSAG